MHAAACALCGFFLEAGSFVGAFVCRTAHQHLSSCPQPHPCWHAVLLLCWLGAASGTQPPAVPPRGAWCVQRPAGLGLQRQQADQRAACCGALHGPAAAADVQQPVARPDQWHRQPDAAAAVGPEPQPVQAPAHHDRRPHTVAGG